MTLWKAAILRSQPRDLGLTSSTAYLLLPHKTNPRPSLNPPSHCKIRTASKVSAVESALYSLPKSSDSGDNGWTDENMAELEKELGLALGEQQVKSSSASIPTSSSPRSAETLQDEIQSRERSETTVSRPEKLRDVSRHGTAQGLEEWEQRETEVAVKGGGVTIQQQEELTAQKEELRQPAVGEGNQQDLVEVVDADDPKNKKATEALPATQPEIDEYRFRLRGIRTQPLARRRQGQPNTESCKGNIQTGQILR
jgi:hypothetical protein